MPRGRRPNKYGVSAWLVTWESTAELDRDRVAAVFRPQLSAEVVRRMVEMLYATSEYSPGEQIRWALKPKENPYSATFAFIDGVRWRGQIHCGHNPFLYARLVDELRAEPQDDGTEQTVWVERPRPDLKLP